MEQRGVDEYTRDQTGNKDKPFKILWVKNGFCKQRQRKGRKANSTNKSQRIWGLDLLCIRSTYLYK